MRTRTTIAAAGGALLLGLLAGLALGADGDSEAKAAGPGPSQMIAGAPAGFAQTRSGAVAAASAFSQSLLEATSLSPDARRSLLDQIAANDSRPAVQARADEAYSVVDKAVPAGQSLFVRSGNLAFRVASYDGSAANIVLWSVDVIGAGSASTQSGWGTKTVALKWEKGDWKLASFPESVEGPTPTLQGQPTAVEQFNTSVKDLERFSDAAK